MTEITDIIFEFGEFVVRNKDLPVCTGITLPLEIYGNGYLLGI